MKILRSYRWRRRFVFWSVPLVLAPLIYLGVHYSNPGNPETATGPAAVIPAQPKHAPFTAEKREAVRPVLKKFILAAVARHDVSRAWDVSAPSLKEGVSRKEWDRGDIPVVPYPAADRGLGTWSFVEYSYPNTVGLEVFLFPQPGSGYSAMTADVELVRDRGGQWLVDYWMPKKFHGPQAVAAPKASNKGKPTAAKGAGKRSATAKPKPQVRTAQPFVPAQGRARGFWWAVPIGLLSLIILGPLAVMLYIWLQNRRAQRDYLRSISEQ